jgi:hypothetical protein
MPTSSHLDVRPDQAEGQRHGGSCYGEVAVAIDADGCIWGQQAVGYGDGAAFVLQQERNNAA